METHASLTDITETVATVLTVAGRLDAVSAIDLRADLDAAFEDGKYRIIVDLTEADFIDSAGLAALASGMRQARQNGGDLRLVYPRSRDARRVFALTRFDQVFVAGDSYEEVESSW